MKYWYKPALAVPVVALGLMATTAVGPTAPEAQANPGGGACGLAINASPDNFNMGLGCVGGGVPDRGPDNWSHRPGPGWCEVRCGAPREFEPVVMEPWFAPQDGFHMVSTPWRGDVLVQDGPPGWPLVMRGDTLVYVEW